MAKKIVIQPVTRVEGHAKITILLDAAGNVSDTKVNIIELRGFERFCIGRPVEELPRIVSRICGVCPWAHHLAASKATDKVFAAEVPEVAKKIRELAYMAHYIHSHTLHFFILSGPDFVMGPADDYSVRNVIGIIQKMPDIAKQVVKIRYAGQMMTQILAGKAIHPDCSVPGGWSKPLTKDEQDKLKEMAKECLEFATFSIDFAKKEIFPKYLDTIKTVAVIETGFLGIVKNGGELNFYDGELRMMKTDGTYEDFKPDDYLDYIGEHVEDWTYLKFPYYKKMGTFSMDLTNPVGIYRVNPLARINVCDKIPTERAQKELEEFRRQFGRPAQPTLLSHWARLIELVYAAERAVQLLDEDLTDPNTRVKVEPRAGRGVGVVEAPRGTLIHDYETDEKGITTDVNIIVGTTHNNAPINMAVKHAAINLIKNGKYDQGLLNTVEMTIRAYDPCFSCATHTLDGKLPIEVNIIDKEGNLIATLQNL